MQRVLQCGAHCVGLSLCVGDSDDRPPTSSSQPAQRRVWPRQRRRDHVPGGRQAGRARGHDATATPLVRTRNATLMASIRSSNYLARRKPTRAAGGACAVPAAIADVMAGKRAAAAASLASDQCSEDAYERRAVTACVASITSSLTGSAC